MIRGSTPLIIMSLPEEMPVADYVAGTLTIAQGRVPIIVKQLAEMTAVSEDNALTVRLTQEETLALDRGLVCEVQLKLMDSDGIVTPSQIARCSVDDILDETVLEEPAQAEA